MLDPLNFKLVYNLGCLLHERGQFEESYSYFKSCLDLLKDAKGVAEEERDDYIRDCLMILAINLKEEKYFDEARDMLKNMNEGETKNKYESFFLMNFLLAMAEYY